MTALRGQLQQNEPMSAHTSWRVGGPADVWYVPADSADLQQFLAQNHQEVFWVGLGSNLLVRDGGLRGAAVCLYTSLDDLSHLGDGRVRAEAGVHCARLAKSCAAEGLTGAAFFSGIPGTLGGALAMNAGAFGSETWDCVAAVDVLMPDGQPQTLRPRDFSIGYRRVVGPASDIVFIGAELKLARGDAAREQARVRELLSRRRATQPVGQPSCGSVFRNPPGDHAARLIELAGLKGFRIGGAEVSAKHANFILNTGTATAADIEALIEHVQTTVLHASGIHLQPEVRIVGEAA